MVIIVNQILATLTIFSHIFLVLGIGYFLLFRKDKTNPWIHHYTAYVAYKFFVAVLLSRITEIYVQKELEDRKKSLN